MPKRTAVRDSDDDEPISFSSASKRSRVIESSSEEDSTDGHEMDTSQSKKKPIVNIIAEPLSRSDDSNGARLQSTAAGASAEPFSDKLDSLLKSLKSKTSSKYELAFGIPARNKAEIHERTMRLFGGLENFTKIGSTHLRALFHIIDEVSFRNILSGLLTRESRIINFRISNRMTSRAGQLLTVSDKPNQHELSVSSFLLFQAFKQGASRAAPVDVNGILCYSRLEALLRIVEHEMIHLLFCCRSVARPLGLIDNDGKVTEAYHGHTFQKVVRYIFGHTKCLHGLETPDEVAFVKHQLEVGALVSFEVDGVRHEGKVNRVQKRVTVLVRDHEGKHPDSTQFSDMKWYRKFYVPMEACKVLKKR
jgi:hypothetical protein